MKKAKTRLVYKRPDKNERLQGLVALLIFMLLSYLLLGFGQIKEMIEVWSNIPKAEAKTLLVVETRERGYTEKQQIMDYIVEVFGDDANLAITMLTKCENHTLDPLAYNYNNNDTTDNGTFQINSIHATREEMIQWKANVDMAYKIYHAQGDKFTAWTCAWVIDQKNYLGE